MRRMKSQLYANAPLVAMRPEHFDSTSRTLVHWLINLRWCALALQVCVAFPAYIYGILPDSRLSLYFGIVAAEFAFQCLCWFLERKWQPSKSMFLLLQVSADLIGLVALLTLTGGWRNPFSGLIFLHIALGAFLLQRFYNLAYFAVICVSILQLVVETRPALHSFYGAAVPDEAFLAAYLSSVVATWLFCTWFSSHMQQLQANYFATQKQRHRMDHLQVLGAFTAGISHAFATPLNTLKIRMSRIGRRHPDMLNDPDYRSGMEALRQCEEQIAKLFEEDIFSSKAYLEKVDIPAFVAEACRSWRADHPEGLISFENSKRGPAYCFIPRVVFLRSLRDIFDNALENRCADKDVVVVSVIQEGPDEVVIRVKDVGKGINDEVRARLGQAFATSREDGCGLGLYTAFSLLETLGGSLEIGDNYPRGTRVDLRLPLAPKD